MTGPGVSSIHLLGRHSEGLLLDLFLQQLDLLALLLILLPQLLVVLLLLVDTLDELGNFILEIGSVLFILGFESQLVEFQVDSLLETVLDEIEGRLRGSHND